MYLFSSIDCQRVTRTWPINCDEQAFLYHSILPKVQLKARQLYEANSMLSQEHPQ